MADQKVAKPALQAALHLAMAGRVLCEGRSEVGAARVPAAQGALDVRGAQVVLELGFRQRAQEPAAVIARREVQEGARDGGGREAAVVGDVAWAQARAVEHLEAGHRPASSRRGKRDHRGRGRNDAPAPGRRPVTQQSTIARGQQGGNEVPLLGEQFWRHPRDDTVLLGGDEPNRSGFSSASEGNPNWFGHAAMVGALAVPAQRRFAPTQPKNRRRSPRTSTTRPGTVVIRLK